MFYLFTNLLLIYLLLYELLQNNTYNKLVLPANTSTALTMPLVLPARCPVISRRSRNKIETHARGGQGDTLSH